LAGERSREITRALRSMPPLVGRRTCRSGRRRGDGVLSPSPASTAPARTATRRGAVSGGGQAASAVGHAARLGPRTTMTEGMCRGTPLTLLSSISRMQWSEALEDCDLLVIDTALLWRRAGNIDLRGLPWTRAATLPWRRGAKRRRFDLRQSGRCSSVAGGPRRSPVPRVRRKTVSEGSTTKVSEMARASGAVGPGRPPSEAGIGE
jgi:hypothetical protein